jgi:hypothetical protein
MGHATGMKNRHFGFFVAIIVLMILGTTFGIGFMLGALSRGTLNCPVEDSCYPSYEDGQWFIVKGERPW